MIDGHPVFLYGNLIDTFLNIPSHTPRRVIMRIALIGIAFNRSTGSSLQKLIDEMETAGDTIAVLESFHAETSDIVRYPRDITLFSTYAQITGKIDFIASIGGDGTFLNAVRYARDSGIPILGINTGRLGYLTSTPLTDAPTAINRVRDGKYIVDTRSLLRVESQDELFDGENFALNDFTIHKKDSASMITIHACVNGVFLNTYWGDGLIVSTPTGSTAYSLSCGGPIVSGECGVIIITPISPHNLNVRPLVVSDDSIITLRAETRNQQFLATLDSRSLSIDQTAEFTVRRESFRISLIRFPDLDFPATIRGKLFWGMDLRN
jgi:NAD+ kinase